MAYVNNDKTPTEVEFQYYRSVSTKNLSNQCDQVIVYKLESNGTWTTTTRNTDIKFAAGDGLAANYANSTLTFAHTNSVTAKTTQGFAQIAYDAQGHITDSTAATTAQADAINSGITSTGVAQIETNKNNIFTVADQSTQYNLINLHDPIAVRNVVPTYLSDGAVTLDVNDAKWTAFNISYPAIVGVTYKFVVRITATTGFSVFNVFIRDTDGEGTNVTEYPTGISNSEINSVGTHVFEFTATATTMWIGFYPNNSSTAVTGSVTMKAQVIEKSLYDAGFTDYQPYALPNATLTPVLKECVDNGVKNMWDFANASRDAGSTTDVKTATQITVTSTGPWSCSSFRITGFTVGETYTASMTISNYNAMADTERIRISLDAGQQTPIANKSFSANGKIEMTFTATATTLYFAFYPNFSATSNSNSFTASEIMICKKSLYDVDPTYQPYALSNAELTNNISYLENTGKKNWLERIAIRGIPTGMAIQYESDDSLTINGTYNGSEYAYVFLYSFTHEAMSYTMSCNVATAASTFYFYTRDDKMSSTSTPKYTYMERETTEIVMRIAPNTSFNNVNVKLMIRPSIITDNTYQPHAMSNAELTSGVLLSLIMSFATNNYNVSNLGVRANANIDTSTGIITQTATDTQTYLRFQMSAFNGNTLVRFLTEQIIMTNNGVYYLTFTKSSDYNTLVFGHNGSTQDFKVTLPISALSNGDYILKINILNCIQANGAYSFNDIAIVKKTGAYIV